MGRVTSNVEKGFINVEKGFINRVVLRNYDGCAKIRNSWGLAELSGQNP